LAAARADAGTRYQHSIRRTSGRVSIRTERDFGRDVALGVGVVRSAWGDLRRCESTDLSARVSSVATALAASDWSEGCGGGRRRTGGWTPLAKFALANARRRWHRRIAGSRMRATRGSETLCTNSPHDRVLAAKISGQSRRANPKTQTSRQLTMRPSGTASTPWSCSVFLVKRSVSRTPTNFETAGCCNHRSHGGTIDSNLSPSGSMSETCTQLCRSPCVLRGQGNAKLPRASSYLVSL